ncbi:MAG: hypothetical protein GF401_10930 [Chitinivibrionales bacterium]|nr:hypothetical protein [Chitinivibrionales bacterium]
MLIRNLLFAMLLLGSARCAQTSDSFIRSRWSDEFHLLRSDNGDTISIGGIYGGAETLYIYDMAGGKIVAFNNNGAVVAKTELSSFGRGTYAGDDFVIRGSEALFLNTVDKRIEVFDMKSGEHKRSISYPLDVFAREPRRTRRVINKIFLVDGNIVLGNSYHYFYFNDRLGKKSANTKIHSVESGIRLENMHGRSVVVVNNGKVLAGDTVKGDTVMTHFPVAGKRYVMFDGRLYSLVLSEKEMKIVEVQ